MIYKYSLWPFLAMILLAHAGTVGATSAAATAERPARQSQPFIQMELKVSDGPAGSVVARSRYLYCDPTGGNHPHGAGACHDLDIARGNLDRLPGVPGKPCSGLYAPVKVTAMGEWRGLPVYFNHIYRNQCILRTSTGPVFQF
ncbi:SSI family serine proteinase inhibitor [Amycolatopsis sp. EV170708-02-1]|uniref:SSI family serine proteinase inhibitor n=1 Tax=Amycolatopsis sp. EV170708-02-1 TaxID=2919322 RepID=UPI001F0C1181|nr:SSI family serine proteinase inhibitor [Amycolatopsis sp. EV170708-02-1]UMP06797.1 subtilase-type protease inhibitor [Amycolatopsis sp. EV170708-02-1]